LIFQTTTGRGLDHRHVGDAFRLAVRRAGLKGPGRLSLHSLRHGFASLLIAGGLDVVFVSRQLGHANPTVTLSTYAHLFARADHAEAARSALDGTAHAMRTVGIIGLGDTPPCGNGCGNSEVDFGAEKEPLTG
jgi:integrase